MSKSGSGGGRRSGSSTRSVYTGGRPHQLQTPIYGSTPKTTVAPNTSRVIGNNTTRETHVIGAPRKE